MELSELAGATRLGVAALIGLSAGLERQWSGHASGANARFAGLRTFLMLGVFGGVAGLLADAGHEWIAAVGLAAAMSLAVVAYNAATRLPGHDLDGTTEVAALAVLMLSTLAGLGWLMVAASASVLVVFVLTEKQRLHRLVGELGEVELRAGLQFALLAVVVLPLLPPGPYLGALAVRPRALWTIVLAFCGLNFASYVARRVAGARTGYGIAGALGGLLSSTAVTLAYARKSRVADEDAGSLARGVIAACTVLIPRILLVSAALNPLVALAAAPYLVPALAVGVLFAFRRLGPAADAVEPPTDRSPLRLASAIQMAIAFQVAMSAIAILRPMLGAIGLYGLAVALGLTDMDALTVSMSNRASLVDPAIAGRALAVGMLANTLFKMTMALVFGAPAFRRRASIGLASLALACVAALIAL